jgi:hypothetical protein
MLRQTRWNKSRERDILGITVPTLDKKINDYVSWCREDPGRR